MTSSSRPARKRVAGAALLVIAGGALAHFLIPSSTSDALCDLSWRRLGHSRGVVVICVQDRAHRPVANLAVTSESHSGRAVTRDGGAFTTDAAGIATLVPGENELVAIWIGSHRVPLPRPGGDLFGPECSSGIVFEATLKKE